MPLETEPLDNSEDSAAYRWGIRGLYAVALGMNIWVLWRMSQSEAEVALFRARVDEVKQRITAPFREQRKWRKTVGHLHWEALQIVEGADTDA